MDKTVLDLAKDKKISDFADVVKAELKKKILDNDFVKSKSDEVNQYQKISDAMAELNKSTEPEATQVPSEEVNYGTDEEK